jgi:hypothetical protein
VFAVCSVVASCSVVWLEAQFMVMLGVTRCVVIGVVVCDVDSFVGYVSINKSKSNTGFSTSVCPLLICILRC